MSRPIKDIQGKILLINALTPWVTLSLALVCLVFGFYSPTLWDKQSYTTVLSALLSSGATGAGTQTIQSHSRREEDYYLGDDQEHDSGGIL